jgi:hypothetical protein
VAFHLKQLCERVSGVPVVVNNQDSQGIAHCVIALCSSPPESGVFEVMKAVSAFERPIEKHPTAPACKHMWVKIQLIHCLSVYSKLTLFHCLKKNFGETDSRIPSPFFGVDSKQNRSGWLPERPLLSFL